MLSLGVAVASPVVKPQTTELVCAGAGVMKLIVKTDDDSQDAAGTEVSHVLDCPMCASVGAPPPALAMAAESPHPLSYAL